MMKNKRLELIFIFSLQIIIRKLAKMIISVIMLIDLWRGLVIEFFFKSTHLSKHSPNSLNTQLMR